MKFPKLLMKFKIRDRKFRIYKNNQDRLFSAKTMSDSATQLFVGPLMVTIQ